MPVKSSHFSSVGLPSWPIVSRQRVGDSESVTNTPSRVTARSFRVVAVLGRPFDTFAIKEAFDLS